MSCVDQISTVRILIEQSNEFLSVLALPFLGFEKVFDYIEFDQIWVELKTLDSTKINNTHTRIIQRLYVPGYTKWET
jgi:hypothetical protein